MKGENYVTIYDEEPKYGKQPQERSIEELLEKSIVIVDKPQGPTSKDVVLWTKDILEVDKTGHSGTLDPKVSGVLPIAVNSGTKIMSALNTIKEYVGVIQTHSDIPLEKMRELSEEFTGTIDQIPPVKSAVKREKRKRKVYNFEILEKNERNFLFRVKCEAGTYIRKLVHDMGEEIGGAHMAELRRTQAIPFEEEESFILQEVNDAYLLWKKHGEESELRKILRPIEDAVSHLGKIVLKNTAVSAVVNGAPLYANGIAKYTSNIGEGDIIALMSIKGELVALAEAKCQSDKIQEIDDIVAKTERVIMDKGVYPEWSK